MCTVKSSDPEARILPQSENSSVLTQPSCPICRVRIYRLKSYVVDKKNNNKNKIILKNGLITNSPCNPSLSMNDGAA